MYLFGDSYLEECTNEFKWKKLHSLWHSIFESKSLKYSRKFYVRRKSCYQRVKEKRKIFQTNYLREFGLY